MLFLAACQSNSTTPVAETLVPPIASPASAATDSLKSEHLAPGMLTITGLPDAELTTKQLVLQLGRPGSIAKGAVECGSRLDIPMGSPDGDMWYYGKTMYEVNGTHAILVSFNVTSGKFRGSIGKLVLNQNTTLEDVRRFFPEAAKEADKPAGHGRPGEEMSLPFYDKDVPLDGALELMFRNGRLQEVAFFSPC